MTLRLVAKDYGLRISEADALLVALDTWRKLDGAAQGTGRGVRRATMLGLEDDGLVRELWAYVVDGDGFMVEPERERRCFALTDFGREIALQVEAAWHQRGAEQLVEDLRRRAARRGSSAQEIFLDISEK